MPEKTKVVYILPLYEDGTDTHFFYNYILIREVAKQFDLFAIIEKYPKLSFGQKIDLGNARYYVQKFSWPPLRFLEMLWLCFKIHASGYKNFYVHYSYYGALASLFPNLLKSDFNRVFYWNRGMPWLFKQNLLKEKLFRFILRHTILITGPESLAKEYVKRYGVMDYRVVSNWVDVERWQRNPDIPTHPNDPNKKNVLFVHHLSKRKGADLIPKIANWFEDDVLFLVIGEGPEKLPVRSNIKLLDKVPNKNVVEYFKKADVFLMPSREEGSPRVLLEAMASGTPFVASDVGGVREIVPVEQRDYLCQSEDVACFQEKIKKLLTDQKEYDKIKSANLTWVRRFDKKRGVEEFVSLFK